MKPPAFWPRFATRCRNLHPGVRRRHRLVAPLAEVSAASSALDAAMQTVETGFLQIGSILETTINIEQKLVAQSHRLLALAEGPEGGTAIIEETAAHIWKGIEFAEANDRQVVDFIARLEDMSGKIRATLPAQTTLTEALNPLKYVQILFRVESATLSTDVQTTFLALNAEISRICERVESGFQEKFALIADIGQKLETASADLRQRQRTTRSQLDALRAQLEKSIGSVKADYTKNQARDVRLEAIVPQLKRETGAVVMSLQAQDMLNQKLQHLNSILRELNAAHSAMPNDRLGGCRTLRFIEKSCCLVTAQLTVMQSELAEAGTQIGGGLSKITATMATVNNDFGITTNLQAEEITIDGGIQNLIDAVENVGTLIKTSQELVAQTYRTIEPVRNLSTHFTRFMRDLTLDIHLIGLNAEVQSAHVAQGTGLEVVSARATEVSLDTCRLSEHLAADIDRITRELGELIDAFGEVRVQTESFFGELTLETKADEDRLHHYRDQVIDVLLQIGEQLPLLEEQTRTALSHTDFSGTAVQQIAALQTAVTTLQTTATRLADETGVTIDTAGMTDQFAKGYTMRSQLDVHQRTLGGDTVAGGAALEAAADATAGVTVAGAAVETGDIELFGFDDPVPAAALPTPPAAPSAPGIADVELWGDEPVAETPAAAQDTKPSAP